MHVRSGQLGEPFYDRVVRRAFAKVNLALAVSPPVPRGQPRAGWHEIASWMVCVDLADEITVSRRDGDTSTHAVRWFDGRPVEWSLDDDLAVRAHRLLESRAQRRLPIDLVLHKAIPAGGGLGGGSSDAAAALLAIRDLFALPIDNAELRELASQLGSDVPFFIDDAEGQDAIARYAPPAPAFVSSFGERVERLSRRPREPMLLIIPPFPCPTPMVYRAFDRLSPGPLQADAVRRLAQSGEADDELLFNDLAEAAETVAPKLADLRRALSRALDRSVHVSGSGSTLFILAQPDLADHARLAAPDCRVEPVCVV